MYQVIADIGKSQFGNIMCAASGGKITMLNIHKIFTNGCTRSYQTIKSSVCQDAKNAIARNAERLLKRGALLTSFIMVSINILKNRN